MTEDEFPFKVGDVVWFVMGSDRCFEAKCCTVTRFNKCKFEPYNVVTISVEIKGGRAMSCSSDRLHLEPPPPPVKRWWSHEEMIAGFCFKPGDRVMQLNYGYGVVLGYSSTLSLRVDFKYLGERYVDPEGFDVRFAKEGDEDWNPLLPPEPFPEPLCKPSEASIEYLAAAIDRWAASVRGFSHGFDCSEEYQHDLMDREVVHGVLNGLQQSGVSVPAELQMRLDEADRWFMELTKDDQGVWHDSSRYDRKIFWYYFRWLRLL